MLGSSRVWCFLSFILLQFFTPMSYGRDAPLNFARIAERISRTPQFEFLNRENFDLLDLTEDDWSSIKIDNIFIPAPKKAAELLSYLKQVEELLNSIDKPSIKFRYGNQKPINIKIPFLGRGHNGAVYEIEAESNHPKVIKITLPRLQAIQSAILEQESYDFWANAAYNSGYFFVPKQYEVHKLGFYRIMEMNKGITLTKYLLMLGAIHIDSISHKNTSYDENFISGTYSKQANLIAQAIQSMLTVIQENPEYCVSLSPNNIHVTYDLDSLAINRIDLVDIGPVPSKLNAYLHLESFEQYLKLCAERLKKYVSEPEYTYDIDELRRYQKLYSGPQVDWTSISHNQ